MKCSNCNSKFNYRLLLGAQFKSNKLECPNCGDLFVITLLSRIIFSLLLVVPFPFFNLLFSSLGQGIVIYTIYLIFIILISPFIIRIKTTSKTINS